MPRTPEQEAAAALHRDADGNGLLVGPDCPTCGRREVAHYRCTVCPQTWEVEGEYRWHWQGLGHWHEPDDRKAWTRACVDHVDNVHGGGAGIVPWLVPDPA